MKLGFKMTDKLIFRKAKESDLGKIAELVKAAIEKMDAQNIHQWDEVYPQTEDFRLDFEAGNLFVGEKEAEIAVVFVLNRDFDDAYNSAKWQDESGNFRLIHRLCVNPKLQGKGVANETLLHIERELKAQGVKSIRLDVFSENPPALRLYERTGYRKTGEAEWRKGRFFLMEKVFQ